LTAADACLSLDRARHHVQLKLWQGVLDERQHELLHFSLNLVDQPTAGRLPPDWGVMASDLRNVELLLVAMSECNWVGEQGGLGDAIGAAKPFRDAACMADNFLVQSVARTARMPAGPVGLSIQAEWR
jgi:hypothetical protein